MSETEMIRGYVYKEASRKAFDRYAQTYDTEMQGNHARALYGAVVAQLKECEPRRVLDLGCGTGALTEQVLDAFPEVRLSGIDLSEEMIARAQDRLGGRADLFQGDSEKLPFEDSRFDTVYCNDSFHHYPDPKRAAFEAWRVLAPGGTLIIGDCWLPSPMRGIMNAFMRYGNDGDVRIYSRKELVDILKTWFTRVSWRRIGLNACIVRAEK